MTRSRTVAILALPGVQLLDVSGGAIVATERRHFACVAAAAGGAEITCVQRRETTRTKFQLLPRRHPFEGLSCFDLGLRAMVSSHVVKNNALQG